MTQESRALLVGTPVLRVEDDRLLRGRAQFIDDLPVPPDTLFLAFLRSPHPHARIVRLDLEAARARPGVVGVFAGPDLLAFAKPVRTPTFPGRPELVRPFIAVDIVRHVGEAVAVVAATEDYLAEDALEFIEADYEPLDPVLSIADAFDEKHFVHGHFGSNVVFTGSRRSPEVDDAFRSASHIVGDRFSSDRISALAMETRGFLSRFDSGTGKLQHHATAHLPHKMRWEIADALGLAEKNVQVIAPTVGGSFGMKVPTYSEDFVGAALARALGRPIKCLLDRQEDLTLMQGREYRFDVEIAFDAEGRILALRNKVVVDLGAYPSWGSSAGIDAGGAAHHMIGPYRVAHYAYDIASVVTNRSPTCAFRGVAAPMCVFAVESLMDRAAAAIGIDPVEIRRRNLIRPQDLPYRNAVGVTHDTASHLQCLERALQIVGYDNLRQVRAARLGADGKYRGTGVACITDHTGQGTSITRSRGQSSRWPGFDGATVRMEPDGKVIAYVSFASQGQGHETVFTQLLADELGMPLGEVSVEQGDTATMPFGTGAGASRAAVVGGGAIIKAGRRIASKIKRIAANILEVSADDIVLADGRAAVSGVPALSLELSRIAATAYMIGPDNLPDGETIGIEATEYFDPASSAYSNATHAVCVAVEADTGRVEIERYVVVHDCGRVVNPLIVEGQVVGAIVQGIGQVLMEAMRFSEDGQPVSTTLLDYCVPTFLEAPPIELHHVMSPSTYNPAGIKGAGEGGITGAIPALVLAISDALADFHPRFCRLPITPDVILELISQTSEGHEENSDLTALAPVH